MCFGTLQGTIVPVISTSLGAHEKIQLSPWISARDIGATDRDKGTSQSSQKQRFKWKVLKRDPE